MECQEGEASHLNILTLKSAFTRWGAEDEWILTKKSCRRLSYSLAIDIRSWAVGVEIPFWSQRCEDSHFIANFPYISQSYITKLLMDINIAWRHKLFSLRWRIPEMFYHCWHLECTSVFEPIELCFSNFVIKVKSPDLETRTWSANELDLFSKSKCLTEKNTYNSYSNELAVPIEYCQIIAIDRKF